MIPLLLFWLIRKYRRHANNKGYSFFKFHAGRPASLSVLLLACTFSGASQHRQLTYKVVRNDSEIGRVSVASETDSSGCHVKVISDIRFRILFRFSAYVVEEATFRNKIMQYSSAYRKWNGDDQVNRQTKLAGRNYEVVNFGKSSLAPYYPVSFHILHLYVAEPVNIQRVYSESFQQMLELKKVSEHTYRLDLPGGDYNEYVYEKGICRRVDLHHSFFTAHMILL